MVDQHALLILCSEVRSCAHFSPLGVRFRYDHRMRKEHRASPSESPLLVEVDPEPLPETLTALGGSRWSCRPSARWGCPRA
jgi:hypothetical protein